MYDKGIAQLRNNNTDNAYPNIKDLSQWEGLNEQKRKSGIRLNQMIDLTSKTCVYYIP